MLQHQLQNQVDKLELKFTKVEQAHRLLQDGILQREQTSNTIRKKTEQEINQHFLR